MDSAQQGDQGSRAAGSEFVVNSPEWRAKQAARAHAATIRQAAMINHMNGMSNILLAARLAGSRGLPAGAEPQIQKLAPIVNKTAKVGRNDPCPCGSGKKFKQCCIDDGRRGRADAKPFVKHEGPTPAAGVERAAPNQDEADYRTLPSDETLARAGYPPDRIFAYRQTGVLYGATAKPPINARTAPWYAAMATYAGEHPPAATEESVAHDSAVQTAGG